LSKYLICFFSLFLEVVDFFLLLLLFSNNNKGFKKEHDFNSNENDITFFIVFIKVFDFNRMKSHIFLEKTKTKNFFYFQIIIDFIGVVVEYKIMLKKFIFFFSLVKLKHYVWILLG